MGARGRGGGWARGRVGVVVSTYTNFRPKRFRPRPCSDLHKLFSQKYSCVFFFGWFSIFRRDRIKSVIIRVLFFFADLALGAGLRPPSSNFRDLRFSTTRDPRSTKILTTEGTRPAVPPSSNNIGTLSSLEKTSPLKKPQQEGLYMACVVYSLCSMYCLGGGARAELCLFVTWPTHPTTPRG